MGDTQERFGKIRRRFSRSFTRKYAGIDEKQGFTLTTAQLCEPFHNGDGSGNLEYSAKIGDIQDFHHIFRTVDNSDLNIIGPSAFIEQ
jgi:hypothetical protein